MSNPKVVVVVSDDREWGAVEKLYPEGKRTYAPIGSYFTAEVGGEEVIFYHGGWGKVAAAASAQYAIDKWSPKLLVNFGTCGGFTGHVEAGDVVLVTRTVIYDIYDQMSGDPEPTRVFYSTTLDLDWLGEPYPLEVRKGVMVTGDRDLFVEQLPELHEKYGAVVGDWESGAIAWVAARNQTRCLILRGVSDLVGPEGGEAYGNIELFRDRAAGVMETLCGSLAGWLALVREG